MDLADSAAKAGLEPLRSNVDTARAALSVNNSRRSRECREFGMTQVVVIDPRCRGTPLRNGHKALDADVVCIFNVVARAECDAFVGAH